MSETQGSATTMETTLIDYHSDEYPFPEVIRSWLGVEQLDEIDGIGPTLAERIVEYRTENGGFSSLDELQDVDGIGEKRLETLREALQP